GELSVRGYVKPVGGIVAKINAARQAGAARVLIPKENWQSIFAEIRDIEIIPVGKLEEVLEKALLYPSTTYLKTSAASQTLGQETLTLSSFL
ncbi:MAG: ATP-dependent protease LonB, partial [Clostridia bacterium]|nr:ATP-dependent protease LonB [Clostridia bacterium]